MFTIELPNVPPDMPAVIVAQAPDATQPRATGDRTIGVCVPVENATRPTGTHGTGLAPLISLRSYLRNVEGKEVATAAGTISVLKKPAHGAITESGEWLDYRPLAGYHGDDQVTVLVELDGTRYQLVHFLHVVDVLDDEDFDRLCPANVGQIAYTSDPSGRLAHFDSPPPFTDSMLPLIEVTLDFGALEGGAVGETESTRIKLVPARRKPAHLRREQELGAASAG